MGQIRTDGKVRNDSANAESLPIWSSQFDWLLSFVLQLRTYL